MNCRKYRACLAGVIVIALVAGLLIFVKNMRQAQIPEDGTLVEHVEDDETDGDGILAWA